MNPADPITEVADTVEEQLAAYLDGELTPQESRAIEERLARDPTYRRRLADLQQADDLLDLLPAADVDEHFTRTTVELIALRAEDDLEVAARQSHWTRTWGLVAAAAGIVVALTAGYTIVGTLVARPNERLLQDLPVIENVDLYRHGESVDFLRRLEAEGLFSEEVSDESM